jgi:hypothetical protein
MLKQVVHIIQFSIDYLLLILSRVEGSRANSNGFGLDLLAPSCTVSLNHNQSTAEDLLNSRSPISVLLQVLN